ncbi:S8 family serine peptidase [Natronospira bacteriovora]|uniref:S8 family serine peptidase n=1 Tax=Natronospira bacteriovora TaxID=3069753 RepID=A0ABU0W9A0_9GAMM|nr:S8 family serine peptidase [Natronospira sp. AB-CW4]MDQ2070612.1 S8 family serine peptidase [Natronospira sp. AB-CW4]
MNHPIRLMAAAILLAIISASLMAAPANRAPVHHFPKGAPAEAPTADWYQERAIYLLRLESAPLAIHHARQNRLQKASGESAGARPEPLNLNSQSSRDWLARLDSERSAFLDKAGQTLGRDLDVVFTYRMANHGFAARMSPAEADRLATLPGVRSIQRDYELELHTDEGPELIGAPAIWEGTAMPGMGEYRGEGVVVGIIDTGINYSNPSFADQGHSNPLGDGVFLGDCAEGEPHAHYCNNKLIGVRGYAVTNPIGGIIKDGDPVDYNGHGSHVAGTAAGNAITVDVGGDSFDITGVAPGANIISYNGCCWVSSLTQSIDDIVVDYATLQAADPDIRMVVNYSIGGSAMISPWESFDAQGFLAAREAGVLPVSSAGNSGPHSASVANPAQAPWVMAVAATTHARLVGATVSVTAPEPVPEDLEGMFASVASGQDGADLDGLEARYAGDVDPGNELGCDAFPEDAFDGVVAVIRRGSCPFSDKINFADQAGAVAAVLVNNVPGYPPAMGLGDPISIPAFMLVQDDGEALIDWLGSHDSATVATTTTTVQYDADAADRLAAFSSRGPSPDPSLGVLTPDLATPGVGILAPYGEYNAIEWGFASGTSMSSPHASGAAALLMGVHPDWSNEAITSALILSAERDITEMDGLRPVTPRDVGGGRIDLEAAANAGFVLDESVNTFETANPANGGDSSSLNLATLSTADCGNSCTLTRTIIGTASGGDFTVSVEAPEDLSLSVSPSTFSIAEGETLELTFSFNDISQAGATGGWVVFQDATGGPELAMPFGLDNLFVPLRGEVRLEGSIRPVTLRRYEQPPIGDEVMSEQLFELIHSREDGDLFVPLLQTLPGNRWYTRVELSAPGYQDLELDNDGEGWIPGPGESIDLGDIHMEALPMTVSLEEVERVERSEASFIIRVESEGWSHWISRVELLRQGDSLGNLSWETIEGDGGETSLYRVEMSGLACGTSYEIDLVARRSGVGDEAALLHAFHTESCFKSDNGGGCTAGDNNRLDPVIPALLLLALIGLAGRLRRQG